MMKRSFLGFFILLLLTLSASAANRFGICPTTCTWDASSTAMWSASSGGATGASVPGSADSVTFDAATCTGGTTCTITVNTDFNVFAITMGACTASTTGCILDFSANNNSPTLTTFNASGAGVRTIKMGSGTWTVSGTGILWFIPTNTNLTFTPGTSNLVFQVTGTAGGSMQAAGGMVYGHVTLAPYVSLATAGIFNFNVGSITIGTLDVSSPNYFFLPASPSTLTVSNAIH
jgi:hypothetical protein